MIYLIGGAPRTGKSTLCRAFSRQKGFGWASTDLLKELMGEAGVDFLPGQIAALKENVELRAVFLGRSRMTLEQVDQYPGKSPGYAGLPEALLQQIATDVPAWSAWIAAQADDSGFPFVDMARGDFAARLGEASAILAP